MKCMKKLSQRKRCFAFRCTALLAAVSSAGTLSAEPLVEQVSTAPGSGISCPTISVTFTESLDFLSQPASSVGTQHEVFLQTAAELEGSDSEVEAVPAPSSPNLGAASVSLERSGRRAVLKVTFSKPVKTRSTLSLSGTRLSIAVDDAQSADGCMSSSDGFADANGANLGLPSAPLDAITDVETSTGPSDANAPAPADVEEDFIEARAAITQENYGRAIQLLTRILTAPESNRSAEAQELLGVVRERNGQFVHAQAEYEIYLERYPEGPAAVRVRQRLNALMTAQDAPPEPLRDTSEEEDFEPDPIQQETQTASAERAPLTPAPPRRRPLEIEAEEDEEEEEEEVFPKRENSGSVGFNYYYNQGTTRLTEFDTARQSVDDITFQNSLILSLNLIGSYETRDYVLAWRISGAHESDFEDDFDSTFRVSRLYLDYEQKDSGLSFRFGRQRVSSGGLLRRFDGLNVGYQPNEAINTNFFIGSPVESVRDSLFQFDRIMYGAGIEFLQLYPDTKLSFYGLEQRTGSFIDRQALGFEAQYATETLNANAALEYDPHFKKLNYARLSGTRIFEDRSTLTLTLDHVLSPTLKLTNAEQGQGGRTLEELSTGFTLGEIKQLAIDRTIASRSVTLSYAKPWDENWLFNFDATVFDTDGSPASGGVPEIEAPGLDYYASLGVYGSNVFSESDVVNARLRFADTSSSRLTLIDGSYRFDVSEKMRLRPRLKIGHRDLKRSGGTEIFLVPSVTMDYEFTDDVRLEVELGGRWSKTTTPLTRDLSTETYAFIGLRRDF